MEESVMNVRELMKKKNHNDLNMILCILAALCFTIVVWDNIHYHRIDVMTLCIGISMICMSLTNLNQE